MDTPKKSKVISFYCNICKEFPESIAITSISDKAIRIKCNKCKSSMEETNE